MSSLVRLEEYLKERSEKFEVKRKFLILSDLIYRPTSEKVVMGFRYFHCDIGALTTAFANNDIAAIVKLPFALDEDGDVDTSAILLDLAYTASGSLFAAQPVEYQDYTPTPVAEAMLLEGEEATAMLALAKALDQSL